jgi:DNA-binding transcriptional LysR family regulator
MMTLAQLRTFCTVARLNSFSRAAEELHLTQPAVSAQVFALEEFLKVKLFDRVGKRISLSEAGRAVLKGGEEILGRVGEMRRELDELSGLRAGTLAIGASQVIGVYLLPRLLAAFRTAYPGIELSVEIEPARRIAELLASNEVDVALVGEGTPFNDERIAMKPVLHDDLILIVPVSHIFAQMKSVKLASLTEMPFIFPRRDSASSESVLEQLAGRGIRPLSVLELGNIGAVKRAVEAGMGVSIVSRMAVQHELADGRLKTVPIAGVKLERQVSLCWHHHRPFSKVTEAFVAFVTREAGAVLAGP